MKMRKTCITDAGMWGIWDCGHFPKIRDYESWEKELLEDDAITKHIKQGHFVPIYLHTDGCFDFEVRVGTQEKTEALSEDEKKCLLVSSEPYLLMSKGQVCFGGYEYLANEPNEDVGCLTVSACDYKVTIHLLEAKNKKLKASLPDFIVLVNPVGNKGFIRRISLETFPLLDNKQVAKLKQTRGNYRGSKKD